MELLQGVWVETGNCGQVPAESPGRRRERVKEYILYEDELPVDLSSLCKHMARQEVIRCRDCEYWQDNNGGYPHPDCPWGKEETPDADDYCSFGERKEGDG